LFKTFDVDSLNFDAFKEWIMQTGLYVYHKPGPNDQSSFPPLKSLECMLEKMKAEVKKKKGNTILYEDPEATAITDVELVKALNEKISEDPDYPVPEGFQKKVEKTLIYTYGAPDYLDMSEA